MKNKYIKIVLKRFAGRTDQEQQELDEYRIKADWAEFMYGIRLERGIDRLKIKS